MKKLPAAAAHIYTKLVIIVGFGIFYFEDFSSLGRFFKALVGFGSGLTNAVTNTVFMQYIFLFLAAVLFTLPVIPCVKKLSQNSPTQASAMAAAGVVCNVLLLLVSSILLLNSTNNPFLYFRF
jgi:alginate O-acetyltransferase complex protein AlgI